MTISITLKGGISNVADISAMSIQAAKMFTAKVDARPAEEVLDACLDGKLSMSISSSDGHRGSLERPVAVYARDPRPGLVDQVSMLLKGALITPGPGRILTQFGKGEWTLQIQLGEPLPKGDRIGALAGGQGFGLTEVK